MRFHDRRGISAALLKGRQMEQHNLIITENTRILTDVFRMTLKGDGLDGHKPGQFVNLKIDGCFLRRPISVYDAGKDFVTILYKIVGKGTKLLAAAVPGSRLDVLTHLGNGFDPGVRCKRPLLIGGGIGCPPLYLLAKELRASGKTPAVLLGFNAPSEVLLEQEFKALVPEVTVVTQGYVTDSPVFTSGAYDYLYTCGPLPMLKAVYSGSRCGGQYSFEERMGCGFGACMGCTCKTKYGAKRICKDGPVLRREEIVW